MNKFVKQVDKNSDKIIQLMKLVFPDAIKIAEDEENYELCGNLHSYITEQQDK